MTIRIPGDVKEALDKALEGEDKDAIIAQFIRDGLAARAGGAGYERRIALALSPILHFLRSSEDVFVAQLALASHLGRLA
jgi:hypothetical protein